MTTTPDITSSDIFSIIHTTRAMRRIKSHPVPDRLIATILRAGLSAPSGGNAQQWRFLVIRDTHVKQQVQSYYRQAYDEFVAPLLIEAGPAPTEDDRMHARRYSAVEYLSDNIHRAPVWIVPCLPTEDGPVPRAAGASIYPAIQNMLLATRALGLASTLTTRHLLYAEETESAMGIPSAYHSYAILPIGWPVGNFGPVNRTPVAQVAYADTWGTPYEPERSQSTL